MLNSGIILAGQQLDVGGAMAQGQAVGENALRLRRESELHNFLAGNGGAVLSGDQGAINALSGHGVAGFNAANQIQQQGVTNARVDAQLDLSGRRMDLSEQQFAFQQEQAQQEAERQIAAELRTMNAEERAQELDNARRSFVMWSQVPEDQRDAWAQANGLTDWVGQDPESVRVGLMTAEQVAAQMEGAASAPRFDMPDGYMLANPSNPRAGVTPIPGYAPDQDSSAAEQQISRLMELHGVDRGTAIKIADGVLRVSRDPVTGESQIVDMLSAPSAAAQPTLANTEPAQPAPAAQVAPTQPAAPQTEQFPAANESFGVGGAGRRLANGVADTFGVNVPFPDVQATQSQFSVLKETLTSEMAAGYPRQPPAFLMKQIQDLIPDSGSVMQGAQSARSQLDALQTTFARELLSVEQQLSGPISPSGRQELERRKAALRSGMGQVTEAISAFDRETNTPTQGQTSGGVEWRVVE